MYLNQKLTIFVPQSSDWVSLRAVDRNEKNSTIVDYGLTIHGVFRVDYGEFSGSPFLSFNVQHIECVIHIVMLIDNNQAKNLVALYIFAIVFQYLFD